MGSRFPACVPPPRTHFDPAKPADAANVKADELRAQFNALKALIDALQAQVDALQAQVNDLPTNAQVNDAVTGAITTATTNAAANSSANTNAVNLLGFTVSDPPIQSETQQILEKVNEFLNAARR